MAGENTTQHRLLMFLILGSSVLMVLLDTVQRDTPHRRKQTTKASSKGNESTPLPNPGNGPCPSANELLVNDYIKRWDDKVASHLRSSRGVLRTEAASWYTLTRDLHLYTAYLDRQRDMHIRIVSLLACNSSACGKQLPPLNCTYKRAQGVRGTAAARVELVWDPVFPNVQFKTAHIICPLPAGWTTAIAKEDLLITVHETYKTDTPKFWINVTQTPKFSKAKCCAVCVRPVLGLAGTLHKVAEFIAHYRVIGAQHLFFYDLAMPDDMKALLARLQSAGIDVTVVQFKLPINYKLVSNWGQMAALHDCIWRSMTKADWYVHVDFDELIVPLRFPSLPAIVNDTERGAVRPRVGSVVFLSRTYCREYGASQSSMDNGELPLFTRLYPFFARPRPQFITKYLARARSVQVAGIHFVQLLRKGTVQKVLREQEGVVNHYRRCCEWRGMSFWRHLGVDLWNTSALLRENATVAFTELAEKDLVVATLKDIVQEDAPT